jgi:putative transposase
LSVRFTTGATDCETKHAVLPRLGRVKLHEDVAGLVGNVDVGTARVISAAVRF